MERKNPIGTAFMTAFIRGFHAINDNPKIFDDSLSYHLVPDEVRNALEQHLIKTSLEMAPELTGQCQNDNAALRLGVRTMAGPIVARARYVEDCLEEAIRKGVSQYVIMGAGLDTFAFRRLDLVDRVRVFEVDLGSAQDIKRQLLAKLGLQIPDYLHLIPIDFTQEHLSDVLARSEYDPRQPSFFSWMGVTHYLPLEAIHSTLNDIKTISSPGSQIVFDYWDKSAFDPSKSSNRIKSLIKNTKRIGEPIITGLDSLTLHTELANLGLRLIENLGKFEIQEKYFKANGSNYSASDHVHFACAVVE